MNEYAAKVAYEGDNTVMMLQSAKYLMSSVLKKKKVTGDFIQYVNNLEEQFSSIPLKNPHKDLTTI